MNQKPSILVTAPHADSVEAALSYGNKTYPCVIGKGGTKPAYEKSEGDGATPLGSYKILRGFYRADRIEKPQTAGLEMIAIEKDMGWDDDINSLYYNQWIKTNYPLGKDESFWREDARYNIILVLDHNGAWPFESERPQGIHAQKGKGSAIFIHVWGKDQQGNRLPTAGCVALQQSDLLEILMQLQSDQKVEIGLAG